MNKIQMNKKIARLQSLHNELQAELSYVDNLLRSVGFPQGLASAKEIALELIQNSGPKEKNF
jgi:hypothetical protein